MTNRLESWIPDAYSGWVPEARCVPSPNYDDRPDDANLDVAVIHAISLPPSKFGGHHIESFFCNQLCTTDHPYFSEIKHLTVSAHFLINREGELVQFVPVHKRAWHAGVSNFQGREAVNDFSIGIELEGCDELPFESIQYDTLVSLLMGLRQRYPAIQRSHITGHSDIAPGRKTDPGPCFDWSLLNEQLDWVEQS